MKAYITLAAVILSASFSFALDKETAKLESIRCTEGVLHPEKTLKIGTEIETSILRAVKKTVGSYTESDSELVVKLNAEGADGACDNGGEATTLVLTFK